MSTRRTYPQHPLLLDWRGHWLTPIEYANVIRRPVGTVWDWLLRSTLSDFNVSCYRDASGRYWIHNTIPPDHSEIARELSSLLG